MTGHELREARRAIGLTQEGLAARLGVDSNTVARWERGESKAPGNLLSLAMLALAASKESGQVIEC